MYHRQIKLPLPPEDSFFLWALGSESNLRAEFIWDKSSRILT